MSRQFHSCFEAKARGVSILISPKVSDRYGCFVIVSARLYNMQIVLVNVYAPNIDDHKFFEHLFFQFTGPRLILFDTQGPQLLVRPCFGLILVKTDLSE